MNDARENRTAGEYTEVIRKWEIDNNKFNLEIKTNGDIIYQFDIIEQLESTIAELKDRWGWECVQDDS